MIKKQTKEIIFVRESDNKKFKGKVIVEHDVPVDVTLGVDKAIRITGKIGKMVESRYVMHQQALLSNVVQMEKWVMSKLQEDAITNEEKPEILDELESRGYVTEKKEA